MERSKQMASSGSFSGSINSGHDILRVDWSQEKNIADNKSDITVKVYLINDTELKIGTREANTLTIDGTEFTTEKVASIGTHLLFTHKQTVAHDEAGAKKLTISAFFNIKTTLNGTYYSKVSANASITLDSNPRVSSFYMATCTMGTPTAIKIYSAYGGFTHTISYLIGMRSGTIATKTSETELEWVPPLELADQMPSATYGTLLVHCRTYLEDFYIGETLLFVKVSVPSDMKPSIGAFTMTRIDGSVPLEWEMLVQTKSKATFVITGAEGAYGSTIKSYQIEGAGFMAASDSLTTGYLNTAGVFPFTASVTDSRGRTATETIDVTVVDYSPPAFLSYSEYRSDAEGNEKNDGTSVRAVIKYTASSCDGMNPVERKVYYRISGATEWIDSGSSFDSDTPFVFGDEQIYSEHTYELKYTITDAFTTISVTEIISTADVVVDFKAGGKGIAVGKVSEQDQLLEIAEDWDISVYGMSLKEYCQRSAGAWYVYCGSAADTADKIGKCDGFELNIGAVIFVRFLYSNKAANPTLNVNDTGAIPLTSYGNTAMLDSHWKTGQCVAFLYNRTNYVSLGSSVATTSYYGVTKLCADVDSTSDSIAATAGAVKKAYDRSSYEKLTLSTPLGVASGGTGGVTAEDARMGLGITAKSLYSGTLTTGSITFSKNYKLFIIIGQASSSAARTTLVIPSSALTTGDIAYKFTDESNNYIFNLSYSDSTVTLAYKSRSGTGQIRAVYGVN